MGLNSLKRNDYKDAFKKNEFDLLVIGGGITGAGIALDAATRGMKVGLIEMQDFAAGTSSRSTKLVHGGLRYLKQLQVGVVAEVGKERAIVYENGPHVTTPEWMLLPFHEGGTFGKFSTSIGLRVYDFLAGVKKEERRTMLSEKQTLEKAPLVKKEGLKGGGYYVEYRTDDARLTIEVMKEAARYGANVLNYAKVEKLLYKDGKVNGAQVKDLLSGEQFPVHAKKIVNATGPWVDTVREMDQSKKGKFLQLTKGVHVVIDQSRFPLKQAVYFDTPDGRMVFAIPRDGKAYVGTTDTVYGENPKHPRIHEADRDYIIKAINYMFPTLNITKEDIESGWAGVRPLIAQEGKGASEISRKDETWVSDSGLITIAGGKLTGYRKMAETVLDLVAKQFANEGYKQFDKCATEDMPISGGHVGGSAAFSGYIKKQAAQASGTGLTEQEAVQLVSKYGSNVPILFQIAKDNADKVKDSGLPLSLFIQLQYAIEHEMVYTPIDFFNRRTSLILFDIQAVRQWKEEVIAYMASALDWTDEEVSRYKEELEEELYFATNALPDAN
ncbi:MAG: glycerol-3-phosphate dehydrogenase/oxidase [Bacillus sp. (in: firmicutes)]